MLLAVWRAVRAVPVLPHLALWMLGRNREIFQEDLVRWAKLQEKSAIGSRGKAIRFFLRMMPGTEELRSLFYYRFPAARFLNPLAPRSPTLYLVTRDIGPGLFLQHGFATIVDAKSIGRDCWINQQVTVGYSGPGNPVIGDNVTIRAGAKVLGGITIGDNVVIGANAFVAKDVPANCVVAGVPARIIRRGGRRVDEPLTSKGKRVVPIAAEARSA